MSTRVNARDVLDKVAEELTDIVTSIGPSDLRDKLLGIARDVDDALFVEPFDEDYYEEEGEEYEELDYEDDDETYGDDEVVG